MQVQVCPAVIDHASMSPNPRSLQDYILRTRVEQMPREHAGKASKPK